MEKSNTLNTERGLALKRTALAVLTSLLSTPYILFIFVLIVSQQIFHQTIAAFETETFLITLHILLLSLIVTILIFSNPNKQLNCRINSKKDIFLLIFLLFLILSFFKAQYKSAYFEEINYWFQALYLYFTLPLIINDDTKDKINGLITAIITTGAITAIAISIVTIDPRISFYIPRNPLADYLVLPFYLSCYRLYTEQNTAKRLIYWGSLFSILLYIILSKSRAVWIGLTISFILLCILDKDILRKLRRALNLHLWEKIIIFTSITILITLSFIYSHRLAASNLVGFDKVIKSFSEFNQGSIYGRLKLWCNSIFILKDHYLFGIGLNNWRMAYPLYSKKLLFDAGSDARPVNFYLKLAIEIGIPGTVALLVYLYNLFTYKSFKSNLNIFMKCALFSIFFVSFFHDLYPYFLPIIFVIIAILNYLRTQKDVLILKRNFLLTFCIFFNLLFLFQSALDYKSIKFTVIEDFVNQYYQHPPNFKDLKDKLLCSLVNQFASASQQSSKINDFFLKITSKPFAGNIYFAFARKEFALSKNYDKTLYWMDKAAELSPLDFKTIEFKAYLEYQSQRFSEAQKTCESYINDGYPGLWMRKILGDIYRKTGDEKGALWQYRLAKNEFDYQLSFITQASIYKTNYYYLRRNVTINSIDSIENNLNIKSPQDSMEKIESTPQYSKTLAYDQKGKKIFFTANLTDGYDLYSFKRKLKTLEQLTKLGNYSPFKLRLSTRDNRIYFTSDWQGNDYDNIFYWDIKNTSLKRITNYKDADVNEYQISPDEKEIAYTLRTKNDENLYIVKNNLKDIYQLTTDEYPKEYLCWNPNSQNIAYVSNKKNIFLYDLSSNSSKKIVQQTENSIKMLRFSQDGQKLLFIGEGNKKSGQIFEYNFKDGQVKQLTQGEDLKLFPMYIDETRIIYIKKIMDNYLLYLLDTQTGKDILIGPAEGVVYGPSLTQTSQELLFLFSDINTPCTICSLSLRNGSFRKLLKLDTIHNDDIIYPQKFSIKAIDNYQVPVYYFNPYHYETNKKYPVIIWFHGGSEVFSPRWDMYTQYFAMNGFAVFALNYRSDNTNDVFQLCQYIKQNKLFDASNIYLVGVSSGAVIIEKSLTEHPELFKGAVELVGVANKYFDSPIHGLPPMKFFLGKNDSVVHNDKKIKQISLQRDNGNLVEFTILEKEGHDFRHQNNIQRTLKETVDFFKKIEDGLLIKNR